MECFNSQGQQERFYKYSHKRKFMEKVGLLKNGTGGLLTQDLENAEVLNVFFTSLLTSGMLDP